MLAQPTRGEIKIEIQMKKLHWKRIILDPNDEATYLWTDLPYADVDLREI